MRNLADFARRQVQVTITIVGFYLQAHQLQQFTLKPEYLLPIYVHLVLR